MASQLLDRSLHRRQSCFVHRSAGVTAFDQACELGHGEGDEDVALFGRQVVEERAARVDDFYLLTDRTAAHDPLTGDVPACLSVEEAAALRAEPPEATRRG